MSSLEYMTSTMRELSSDGCQNAADLRPEEDGGDSQMPASRDGGDSQIPATCDGTDDSEEAEDGYRTPTSPEHRIPEALECPPAPRKPKREVRLKRKRAFEAHEVDSEEIELFFRQIIAGLLAEGGRKIRKLLAVMLLW